MQILQQMVSEQLPLCRGPTTICRSPNDDSLLIVEAESGVRKFSPASDQHKIQKFRAAVMSAAAAPLPVPDLIALIIEYAIWGGDGMSE